MNAESTELHPPADRVNASGQDQRTRTASTEPDASVPGQSVVWVRISPSQVMRTVTIALLTATAVLGTLFILWQLRSFIGWFAIALSLAAVLNPAVNWLQGATT
jgi:hypothetical protein